MNTEKIREWHELSQEQNTNRFDVLCNAIDQVFADANIVTKRVLLSLWILLFTSMLSCTFTSNNTNNTYFQFSFVAFVVFDFILIVTLCTVAIFHRIKFATGILISTIRENNEFLMDYFCTLEQMRLECEAQTCRCQEPTVESAKEINAKIHTNEITLNWKISSKAQLRYIQVTKENYKAIELYLNTHCAPHKNFDLYLCEDETMVSGYMNKNTLLGGAIPLNGYIVVHDNDKQGYEKWPVSLHKDLSEIYQRYDLE